MISIDKVIRAAYRISEAVGEKALKALGVSTKGKPGRKGDGIIVGRDRVRAQKKIDQIAGGAKGITAAAILHELLGISSTSKDADKVPTIADIKAAQADDPRKDRGTPAVPRDAIAPREGKSDSSPMSKPTPKPTPKPNRKPAPKTLPTPKPKRPEKSKDNNGVKFVFTGTSDFRKGGMVHKTVNNLKKK